MLGCSKAGVPVLVLACFIHWEPNLFTLWPDFHFRSTMRAWHTCFTGEHGGAMQDIQAYLEKLTVQACECEMIRDLATDPKKRELFTKLAEHFKVLAGELEREMGAVNYTTKA